MCILHVLHHVTQSRKLRKSPLVITIMVQQNYSMKQKFCNNRLHCLSPIFSNYVLNNL